VDDQSSPVDDSEFVYRRVHRSFVDEALALPIQPAAFRPNPNDTTGLSVFRARFVQPADTLTAVPEAKRGEYVIARIAVRDLLRLGLSLKPDPDPDGPPGHAIIPELSWPAYSADKKHLKVVQLELATLASRDIVHRPTAER
jgi:hypothetical protein